jgi:hypothetical protein
MVASRIRSDSISIATLLPERFLSAARMDFQLQILAVENPLIGCDERGTRLEGRGNDERNSPIRAGRIDTSAKKAYKPSS